MKRFVFSLILTILITFFSFYSVTFLEKTSLEMGGLLAEVKEAVQDSNWQLAEIKLKEFNQEWEKWHFWWELLMDHSEVDNISISLAYLQSYLETESPREALAEINAIFDYLKQIPEGEKLTIRNLF
jgi:hypothetical protein